MDNREKIRESCFKIAEVLIWKDYALTSEKVEENMNEISIITDNLFNIALDHYFLVDGMNDADEVLIGAIDYIERAHAIPPLKGHYIDWFQYTLQSLLELCNPNSLLKRDHLPFIESLEKGLKTYRDNIVNE